MEPSNSTLIQLPQGLTGPPRALHWAILCLCRLWESAFRFAISAQNSCGKIAAQGGQKSWQRYLKSTRTSKWWDGKLVSAESCLVNIERQPGGLPISSAGNLMHLGIYINTLMKYKCRTCVSVDLITWFTTSGNRAASDALTGTRATWLLKSAPIFWTLQWHLWSVQLTFWRCKKLSAALKVFQYCHSDIITWETK